MSKGVGKKDPYTLLVGKLSSSFPMENNRRLPKILKTELPYDLAIPLLSTYPKNENSLITRDV